jgi:indolepyruvate ferredoxin oxidoreductase
MRHDRRRLGRGDREDAGGLDARRDQRDVAPTGGFTQDPNLRLPERTWPTRSATRAGRTPPDFLDATKLATALLGDSIATNLFMVGYAWQKGLIPVSVAAILQAIELNGAAVESNKRAFDWGRRAAVDLQSVERAATPPEARVDSQRLSQSIEEMVERRTRFLTDYQDSDYASRYVEFVDLVRNAEQSAVPGSTELTEAVARYLFKLMAYKDEYEVARLYTQTDFLARIANQFEGDYRVNLHLAPPLWAKPDPVTGEARKRVFGPWMLGAMRFLARFKGLRGTALDIFGYSKERRTERKLIDEYRATVESLLGKLDDERLPIAVEIAGIPELIRGYGHVKDRHLKDAKAREAELLEQFRDPAARKSRTIPIRAAA